MSELPYSPEQIEFEQDVAAYDTAVEETRFSAAEALSENVINSFVKAVSAHPEQFSYFYSYLVAKTSMANPFRTPFGGRAFTEKMRDLCAGLGLNEEATRFQAILDDAGEL